MKNIKDVGFKDLSGTTYNRGHISVESSELTSLEGSPEEINNSFYCQENNLKSLKYSPKIVKGVFNCSSNKLYSLEYCPKIIKESFICSYNNLNTLKYMPEEIGGSIDLSYNLLTTLEGSPEEVKDSFYCNDNILLSLKGRPKSIYFSFNCKNNPNLKNVKEEIIKNQIVARYYTTDDGVFYFDEIKEEFEKYTEYLFKKEKIRINKEEKIKKMNNIKENKKLLNDKDYGLSI